MGTNFPDFLQEANRVMKYKGVLMIAEVVSRFTDVKEFCKHMKEECGFHTQSVKTLKGFFYIMIFTKCNGVKDSEWTKEFSD